MFCSKNPASEEYACIILHLPGARTPRSFASRCSFAESSRSQPTRLAKTRLQNFFEKGIDNYPCHMYNDVMTKKVVKK